MSPKKTSSSSSSGSPKKSGFPWGKLFLVLSLLAIGALVYLDATVRYNFSERQWQLPARVYARALSLQPGLALNADDLVGELAQLGYRVDDRWRQPGTYRRVGNRFWIVTRGKTATRGQQRNNSSNNALRFQLSIEQGRVESLQDAGSRSLSRVALEPLEIGSIYPSHREDRILVKLEQAPRILRDIVLLVEDRGFYEHHGISPRAIARALLVNVRAGATLQGGSTITQQLVKNVFLSADRSLWRKGVEAIMSLLLELHYSKDEIFEAYINEVYLGQEGRRAIHGFALASKHYFNRPLEELSPAQIALLVGMVKGPSYYDPWRHPDRAKTRRDIVLDLMAQQELVLPQQLQTLKSQPLGLAKANALANVYPAYLDLVRRQLRRDYSQKNLQSEGMRIYTAFDPIVQRHAEASLSSVLSRLDKPIEGAMVVTDVRSGDVVAVVGGRQMRYAGFNRALDAVRPVGSLVKPAVYLAALKESQRYTLATPISDGPVEVAGHDGSIWRPRNFDRESHGNVLLHEALAHSYNQATARLGMELGLAQVVDMLQRLGVKRHLPELPSLLLGAVGLSPLEVAGMYQTIASSGSYSPLRSITEIADHQGRALARYPVQQESAVDKPLMHLLHYAMLEVVREGTGKMVYQRLPEDFKVAGKTGTTDDLRDSWFAGFSGDYLAVVWLGRDDNKTAGLTGSLGALKVWREFMFRASNKSLDFSVPPGVAYHWIDSRSGLLTREYCENARYMPFLQGTAPSARMDCKTTLPGVLRWFKNLF